VPKVPIADWQIWNEPNFSLFWKPAPDARRYLELLRVFHDVELAADRRERLGIAGVVWYSLRDTPGPFWPGHCGLFELDGRAKASWEALKELTGGNT
jgi:hypothetical protein